MPKRVFDGDAWWSSATAARLPEWMIPHYSHVHALALANGVFECAPRIVWAKCYAPVFKLIGLEDVTKILNTFNAVGLLFRWTQNKKLWGYWTKIDKPGRLPGKSRRGTNEVVGPEPPEKELAEYIKLHHIENAMDANGFQKLPYGNEKLLGFGSGFGSGSGEESTKSVDSSSCPASPDAATLPALLLDDLQAPAMQLALLLAEKIQANNPRHKPIGKHTIKTWAIEADLAMRRDSRTAEEIRAVILWSQADPFWLTNILSMQKVREKFDQLVLKMKSNEGRPHDRRTESAADITRRNLRTAGLTH